MIKHIKIFLKGLFSLRYLVLAVVFVVSILFVINKTGYELEIMVAIIVMAIILAIYSLGLVVKEIDNITNDK